MPLHSKRCSHCSMMQAPLLHHDDQRVHWTHLRRRKVGDKARDAARRAPLHRDRDAARRPVPLHRRPALLRRLHDLRHHARLAELRHKQRGAEERGVEDGGGTQQVEVARGGGVQPDATAGVRPAERGLLARAPAEGAIRGVEPAGARVTVSARSMTRRRSRCACCVVAGSIRACASWCDG
jgi:hypothetical protein